MLKPREIYCPFCKRFLGREDIKEGLIEIKCHGCKHWLEISVTQEKVSIKNSELDKVGRKE